MCNNGHNVCDICKTARDSSCPVCQKTTGDNTNIELEALIKHFKAPMSCKHNGAGCNEANDLDEILRHEEDCPFRSTKCLVLDCKADITLNELENHMTEKHQDMIDGAWVIRKSQSDVDLHEMAKLMVKGASVVRGRDWNYGGQDGNPPGTGIILNTYFLRSHLSYDVEVQWKSGKTSKYKMGTHGTYDLKPASSKKDERYIWEINQEDELPFAIRSWRHSNVRFFATLFIGLDNFWHIMVSAACGKNKTAKFRAEIRLASSSVPECSNVYHRPVEHLESEVDLSSIDNFPACLDVHKKVVEKQTGGKVTSVQVDAEDIPFSCKVYEKVFVTFDKEDIDEKED